MSRIKEVTLKELRLNLTELTEDLDDQTTLVITRRRKPIAVIQHLDKERQLQYRKLLDAVDKSTEKNMTGATKTTKPGTPVKKS